MSRNLPGPALASVLSEVSAYTMAAEFDFPSGVARFNAGVADLNLPSQISGSTETFLGIGLLGSIAPIQEGAEVRSYGTTVQLSGVPRDMVAVALGQAYQGRPAVIYLVHLNTSTWQPLSAPSVVFRGRMDQMDIALGDTATITVKLENRLADWERPRMRRYTAEDHRSRYPGDEFLDFVSAAAEKRLQWPAR